MNRFGPGLVLVLGFCGVMLAGSGLSAHAPASALFGIVLTVLLVTFAVTLVWNALR